MVLGMSSQIFALFLCALATFTTTNARVVKSNRRRNTTSPGLQNLPIKIASTANLGYATDDQFNPGLYRDGGGGGLINGINVVVFADTWTTLAPYGPRDNGTSFVHNSIAYMGIRNATDPTKLYDFGTVPYGDGNRRFLGNNPRQLNGLVAMNGSNETYPNLPPNTQIAIWPNNNLIPLLGSNSGLAVYPVINITSLSPLYNTMVQIDIDDPMNIPNGRIPNATRVVPRLFYNNENMYGSFSIYRAGTAPGEPLDNNLYLFAASDNGIKVARVPLQNKAQRHYYKYWNRGQWSTDMPAYSDVASDVIPYNFTFNYNGIHLPPMGPKTGEFFWSPYFQTFICIFMGDVINDAFYISYSLTQQIMGPYSKPVNILNTFKDSHCSGFVLNYAGHAYPGWDPTGKTMLLSWSSCNAYITMAQLTFA